MRILIVSLQGIGNTIMTLYAAERLRDKTNAEISFMVSNNGSNELVVSEVWGDHLYIWDESKSTIGNIARLAREIRKTHFDEVYLAYPSWKREGVTGLFARSVAKKVVFDSESNPAFFKYIFKTGIRKTSGIHDINTNYLLFEVANDGYLESGKSLAGIVNERHEGFARKYIAENGLQGRFVIAVHPGSKGEGKRWDAQKFVQLCKELHKNLGCRFVVIGGEDELMLKEIVARGAGESAVVLNSTSLLQTASVVSKCDLFIGNDSAPMHLSVLMGTPVVALWGYSDLHRTAPYGPGNIVIRTASSAGPFVDSEEYMNDLRVEHVVPVVSRYVESLTAGDSTAGTIGIDSFSGEEPCRIYRLEHGCLVIEYKGRFA